MKRHDRGLRVSGPVGGPGRPADPAAHARRGWRTALVLTGATITVLALLPHPPDGVDTGWDKLNHALAFAVMAVLGDRAGWPLGRTALLVLLLAWGGAIELAQSALPPRSAEWSDWLADAVGLAAGAAVAALSARRRMGARPR